MKRRRLLEPKIFATKPYIAIYGSEAAIYIEGYYGYGPLFLHPHRGEWQEIPLPAHIVDSQPDIADDTQRNWSNLAQEFVADIRSEESADYQTFRDGWIYQEIIEVVRASNGWIDLSPLYEIEDGSRSRRKGTRIV